MKNLARAAIVTVVATGSAQAGGIDRSGQSIEVLFERGNYAEFSFGAVSPSVSGTVATPLGQRSSGDIADSYFQVGAAYKHQATEKLSFAIIYDQPFGADVKYSGGSVPFAGTPDATAIGNIAAGAWPIAGTDARLDADAITGLLNYRFTNGFGVHGGFRVQTVTADSNVPLVAGYSVDGQGDEGLGYVAGLSYEKPEIALRVSLTYNSTIETTHRTTETTVVFGTRTSKTKIETPESINLNFQSGIAKDTLVFGSVRWVNWSDFTISPRDYQILTGGPFLSYTSDTYTYTLGVGRQFTKNFSGSLSATYEDNDDGSPVSNLGPTSGKLGFTVGARYENENGMILSGGVNYTFVGDAVTTIGALPRTQFKNNDAIGVGFKVAYRY
ncbi:outer membrane protein transport protein [Roseovarius sp. A-2]|uniref:hypothetical protein n=1 Tax=Roseovarius sp. A-2 TaxID=1570360 RepID=UPI0009B56620|nr:hypothetical protein [Roseovarius sp. A-2]GAW33890.1 outer membrane protein transport protein [Roseovarius sp. A-2]